MFAIIGIVVVFAAIIAGFLMEKGHIAVLVQPAELLIIAGAAAGTLLVANPMRILKAIVAGLIASLKGSPFTKARYLSTLKMMYQFLNKVRKEGLLAVEMDVEKPKESAIFKNYPEFLSDHHALDFVCDTLRTAITGGVEPFDMDQMMELDMEVHHHAAVQPVDALTTVADSLPGLGIVAAVLGVVITMGSLGGPPEEIGKHVAAALVGTFLGILLCYGVVGPLAANMTQGRRRAQRISARAARAAARVSERLGADDRDRAGPARDSRLRAARASTRWKRTARTRRRGGGGCARRSRSADKREERANDVGESTTDHRDQEEGRPRRPSRRRVEGGLRRFRDRDDGAVHRAVADGLERKGEKSRGRILQRSERNRQSAGHDHGGQRQWPLTPQPTRHEALQELKEKLEEGDQGNARNWKN